LSVAATAQTGRILTEMAQAPVGRQIIWGSTIIGENLHHGGVGFHLCRHLILR
jgi:hypothetical protein